MTRYKWLNRWIMADVDNFHIVLAIALAVAYALGILLPSERLRFCGYTGMFLLVLVQLTHMYYHASDQFFRMHPDTDCIPKEQIKRVNGIYLACFLAFTGTVMAVLPMLRMEQLRAWLKSLLYALISFLVGLLPKQEAVTAPEAAAEMAPPAMPFAGLETETSLFAKVIDILLSAAAAILLVCFLAWGIYQLYRLLCRIFAHPEADADEKVFLKPADAAKKEKRNRKSSRPLWLDYSVNGRIRKAYKKKLAVSQKESTPLPAWATPAQLEELAGVTLDDRDVYHEVYEKARYSGKPCEGNDLKKLH